MFGQPLARYVAAVVVGGCLCLVALIATGGLDLLDARQPRAAAPPHGAAPWWPSSPRSRSSLRGRRGRDHHLEHLRVRAADLLRPRAGRHRLRARHDPRRRDPPQAAGAHRASTPRSTSITVAAAGCRAARAQRPPAPDRPDRHRALATCRASSPPRSSSTRSTRASSPAPSRSREQIGFLRYLASDLFLQASTAGLLLGLSPVLVLAADFSLAVAAAAVPAAARRPPRRPPGDRQGAPGAARRAHRPAQPRAVPRPHRAGAARRRAPPRRPRAVMLMDLDHFKEVNDTLGHHDGDVLLQEVAERLKTHAARPPTPSPASAATSSASCCPSVARRRATRRPSPRCCSSALREPFVIDGLTLEIDGAHRHRLPPRPRRRRRDADPARRHRHVLGQGGRPRLRALRAAARPLLARAASSLAGELRSALESGELELYYQPKADARHAAASSASRRWCAGTTRATGLLGPSEFVPIAEQTGLIAPLTRCVLDAALRQCRAWQDAGLELSRRGQPLRALVPRHRSWRSRSRSCSRVHDVDADAARARDHREHAHARPGARRRRRSSASAEIGVTLSIDDFGTGYSSLAYLKRLPVDEIKIDKSFVIEMATTHSDAAIVRSTIDLAHNLGLQVVAEGVEDRQIWARARARSAATSPRATTSRARCRPRSWPRSSAWRRPTRATPSARRCGSSPASRGLPPPPDACWPDVARPAPLRSAAMTTKLSRLRRTITSLRRRVPAGVQAHRRLERALRRRRLARRTSLAARVQQASPHPRDAEQPRPDVGADDGADLGDELRLAAVDLARRARPAARPASGAWMCWMKNTSAPVVVALLQVLDQPLERAPRRAHALDRQDLATRSRGSA